jgi:uncharacterized membrane protein YfcA
VHEETDPERHLTAWGGARNLRPAGLKAPYVGGSITGTLLGALLLGVIPDLILTPSLAIVLLISAIKVARHT